ncbi:hypothetical protein ABTZ03_32090 [Kitasatospora sp. NPDC096077]|uniref:hypothetical protein n=1 Tax=Kitasatospora sp. NPDC096077 TaxID=3155544 RepID=UPI0033239F9A
MTGESPLLRIVAIVDWYDGAREGVAQLATSWGDWWYFRTLATHYDPESVDHCLYAFTAFPAEAVPVLEEEFGDAGRPPIMWPDTPGEVTAQTFAVVEAAAADPAVPSLLGRVTGRDRRCELWDVHRPFGFTGSVWR